MVKRKMAYVAVALVMALAMSPVSPIATWIAGGAEVSATEGEVTEVHDGTELYNAMLAGGTVRLANDVDAWYWMYVPNDTTLDLNGYTIQIVNTYNYDPYIWVYGEATLTITGEGAIAKNYTSNDPAVWVSDGGKIVLENGVINATGRAVAVSYTSAETGAEFEMNGGRVVSANDFGIVGWKDAKVTINDGAISSKYSCISGNGNAGDSGAEFYVNGGTLTSEGWAIYEPQIDGVVEINGGEIYGATTGIEVRSGDLTITGGTITAGGAEYKVEPSGSGSTTYGAAVAVAQHTTRQPINVDISGGTFSGAVAFSEANPQEGDAVEVAATITGGRFIGTIVAEDLENFVQGGEFANEPSEDDIAEGEVAYRTEDGYVVANLEELAKQNLEYADDDEDGIYELMPIKIDWNDMDAPYLEALYNESGFALGLDPNQELIADRLAELRAEEDADLEGYTLVNGGELYKVIDIDLVNCGGERIEVRNNNFLIWINLSAEDYAALSEYDGVAVVYFDDDGNEVERLAAELIADDYDNYWLEFTTTHLSVYGIVGVNNDTETSTETTSPDTGTVTREGASAMGAAIVTAVAVGIIVAVSSFVVLIGRK